MASRELKQLTRFSKAPYFPNLLMDFAKQVLDLAPKLMSVYHEPSVST